MSHKNDAKTKKRNWRYTIFTSLNLNQLLEVFNEVVSVRDCYRSYIFL